MKKLSQIFNHFSHKKRTGSSSVRPHLLRIRRKTADQPEQLSFSGSTMHFPVSENAFRRDFQPQRVFFLHLLFREKLFLLSGLQFSFLLFSKPDFVHSAQSANCPQALVSLIFREIVIYLSCKKKVSFKEVFEYDRRRNFRFFVSLRHGSHDSIRPQPLTVIII